MQQTRGAGIGVRAVVGPVAVTLKVIRSEATTASIRHHVDGSAPVTAGTAEPPLGRTAVRHCGQLATDGKAPCPSRQLTVLCADQSHRTAPSRVVSAALGPRPATPPRDMLRKCIRQSAHSKMEVTKPTIASITASASASLGARSMSVWKVAHRPHVY